MGSGYNNLSVGTKQTLQDIARMAYGSGRNEGRAGGAGRMGICDENGSLRLVKFNTHWYERWAHVSKSDYGRMERSSSNLRNVLHKIAKAVCNQDELASVERALGFKNANDQPTEPKGLLDRKIVASVVDRIGGDSMWKDALRGQRGMEAYATGFNQRTNFDAVLSAGGDTSHAKDVKKTFTGVTWKDFKAWFKLQIDSLKADNKDLYGKVEEILNRPAFKDAVKDSVQNVMNQEEMEAGVLRCLQNVGKLSSPDDVTEEMLVSLLISSERRLTDLGYHVDGDDAAVLERLNLTCTEFDSAVRGLAGRFGLGADEACEVGDCVLKYLSAKVKSDSLNEESGSAVLQQIKDGTLDAVTLALLAKGIKPAAGNGQPGQAFISAKLHGELLDGASNGAVNNIAALLPVLEREYGGNVPLSPIVLEALLKASDKLELARYRLGSLSFEDVCRILVPDAEIKGFRPKALEAALADRVGMMDARSGMSALMAKYGLSAVEAASILSDNVQETLMDRVNEDLEEMVEAGELTEEEKGNWLQNLGNRLPLLLKMYERGRYDNLDEDPDMRPQELILCRPKMREQRLEIIRALGPGSEDQDAFTTEISGCGYDRLSSTDSSDRVEISKKRQVLSRHGWERIISTSKRLLEGDFGWMRGLLDQNDPLLLTDIRRSHPSLMLMTDRMVFHLFRVTMLQVVQKAISDGVLPQNEVTAGNLDRMLRGDFSMIADLGKRNSLQNLAAEGIANAMVSGDEWLYNDSQTGKKEAKSLSGEHLGKGLTKENRLVNLLVPAIKAKLKEYGGAEDPQVLEFLGDEFVLRMRKAAPFFNDADIEYLRQSGVDVCAIIKKVPKARSFAGAVLLVDIVRDIRQAGGNCEQQEDEIIGRLKSATAAMSKDYDDLDKKELEENGLIGKKEDYEILFKLVYAHNRTETPDVRKAKFLRLCKQFDALVAYVASKTGSEDKSEILSKIATSLFDVKQQMVLSDTIGKLKSEKDYNTFLTAMKAKFDKLNERDRKFKATAEKLKGTKFYREGRADEWQKRIKHDVITLFKAEKFNLNDKDFACDLDKLDKRLKTRGETVDRVLKEYNLAKDPGRRAVCGMVLNLLFLSPLKWPFNEDLTVQSIDFILKRFKNIGFPEQLEDVQALLKDSAVDDKKKVVVVMNLLAKVANSRMIISPCMRDVPRSDIDADAENSFVQTSLEGFFAEYPNLLSDIKNLIGRVGEKNLKDIAKGWEKTAGDTLLADGLSQELKEFEGSKLETEKEGFLKGVASKIVVVINDFLRDMLPLDKLPKDI